MSGDTDEDSDEDSDDDSDESDSSNEDIVGSSATGPRRRQHFSADEKKKPAAKEAGSVALPKPTPPKGPESYRVKFVTSCGDFVVEVTRKWAPLGADRFHEAVSGGFYDECRFFRVVPNFVVQFGINGDPKVQRRWKRANLKDDRAAGKSNLKGTLTFATSGPNTRTSQLFISLKDNSGSLDGQGFSPFGRVVSGMEAVDKITAEYGERPQQQLIEQQGNVYLEREFPNLDHVKTAVVAATDGGDKADKAEKKN